MKIPCQRHSSGAKLNARMNYIMQNEMIHIDISMKWSIMQTCNLFKVNFCRSDTMNIKEIFETRVLKTDGNGGCWIWDSGTGNHGYGRVLFLGVPFLAHRFSYELYNDKIPPDKSVLHKCHNRLCVNPAHIYLGDAQDNARDWVENRKKDIAHYYVPIELKKMEELEKDLIISTLKNNQNSRAKTARDLGLSTTTLWRKMKKCGLQ